MKYNKWIKKNVKNSLINKEVLITGSTGGIGKNIAKAFLYLKANIILPCRNVAKGNALRAELLKEFPQANINIMRLDLSSIESIDCFINELEGNYTHIDYLINNAGIYHLPSAKSIDNIEIHLATNAVGPTYLTIKMIPILSRSISAKIIAVGSLSYKYADIDIHDFEGIQIKGKTKLYAKTKRILICNMLKIKKDIEEIYPNITLTIVHPGVSATNLFDANKGGFSKTFNLLAVPIMKLIFFSPAKASLSCLYAIEHQCKINEWITPRGLLEVWGFPTIHNLDKSILDYEYQKEIYNKTISLINE